ncbi:MAG TPA: M12 family metallopeptidase [Ferruginibacter sp.]|nr:M12 family metallopeptidase [Ferruginibacter sp.]
MKQNKTKNILLALTIGMALPSVLHAQVPENYVVTPLKKIYTKFQNPLIKSGRQTEVMIINGQAYLEGDIALGSQAELDAFQSRITAQAVVTDDNILITSRWAGGIVPFVILNGFTDAEEVTLLSAMNHIASNTNVCFRLRTNETSYIKFKKYTLTQLGFSGGSSFLGRCGFCLDGQEIKLSAVKDAVVRHEIGHALGLMHEQSREDRNNFVEIITANIKPGFEGNFGQSIYTSTDVGTYDFLSIMHYFSTAFGKDKPGGGRLQTIRNKTNPSDQSFGFASSLSTKDRTGINNVYPTSQSCATLTALAPGELAVNESKAVTISANKVHDLTGIFMRSGQRFQFSTASPAWSNGSKETDCDGYEGTLLDAGRRHGDIRMMTLTGEIFAQNNANIYTGTYFKIGCSRTVTVTKTGFLVCFANDNILTYGDNSGVVTLTVKRLE